MPKQNINKQGEKASGEPLEELEKDFGIGFETFKNERIYKNENEVSSENQKRIESLMGKIAGMIVEEGA